MKRLTVKEVGDGSRTVICKNGGNDTLAGLRQLRQDRNLCDVIIKVEEAEILAHRSILIINSPYFHAMFREGFSEAQTREVRLQAGNVDLASVQALVDFMYTGQLQVSGDSVQGLIMAADHWQMTEVKKMCEDYMERLIDADNCLGIWKFAEVYGCEHLSQKSQELLKQRFPLVVQGPEFLHLSLDFLQRVLGFPDLSLGHEGEDVVAKAMFRWLDHHQDLPSDVLTHLLRTIHWSATSLPCRHHLLLHPIVSNSEELQQLIQVLVDERPEAGRQAQTSLYVIGGFLQSRTGPKCPRLKSVERLDGSTSRWTACADFPMLSSAAVAFSLHGHLFCCACEPISMENRNATVTRTGIFEYSMIRDEWSSVESQFSVNVVDRIDSCLQAEGALAVCPQSSAIYLVSHSEVTMIDVTLVDDYILCQDAHLLPRPRTYFSERQRQHAAIILGSSLYVLGGDRHDAGTDPVPTARVIMLDLEHKQWLPRTNMLEARAMLGVAALKGKIYACGGYNTRRLATMECYDPATDQWTALTAMHNFRSHHQLLALHNTLWAIGGKSYAVSNGGARKVLSQCEVYDPDSDTWTGGEAYKMKHARCAFAAVAV